MAKRGVLYWITGLSGSGKTTIGNRLLYELRQHKENIVILDGDILKRIVDEKSGYSREDRKKRAVKYAMMCKMLTDQGIDVICCTIAMFDEVREWNRKNNAAYLEIFLDVPMKVLIERDQKGMYTKYANGEIKELAGMDGETEFPKTPDLTIINDGRFSVKECVDKIIRMKPEYSSDFDRDTEYWNDFYSNRFFMKEPSLFAQFCFEKSKKTGNLLELGCGNGRDSIYFCKKGLNVTAIDASDQVISLLKNENKEENICFVCDDFVCSPALFVGQFDYCYSRFSIHAINEEQETQVIGNVYGALKAGGKFFIETRSIHDELYGKGKEVGRHAYIYQEHYRRFLVKEELEEKLKQAGFSIEYSEENRGFAPFEGTDPPVIRVVALKEREQDLM